MDLEARKLNIISYLIKIKDIELFERIEESIFSIDDKSPFKRFTPEELIERTKISENDYLAGNYTSQEVLEKESEEW